MRSETLSTFHGANLYSLQFKTPDELYKRILFLPASCYFHIRPASEFWLEAYSRILKEFGIIFIKIDAEAEFSACFEKIAAAIPAMSCPDCSSILHQSSVLTDFVIMGDSDHRVDIILCDRFEIFSELSDQSYLSLTNLSKPFFDFNFGPNKETISELEPFDLAILELNQLGESPDYKQYTFLMPGVIMIIDNKRFSHAVTKKERE